MQEKFCKEPISLFKVEIELEIKIKIRGRGAHDLQGKRRRMERGKKKDRKKPPLENSLHI